MNEIQEKRMRGYFITAAKDLIRGEGLVVVSARNVAERAGFSYATLYNYFKDIRDLIFCCVEDFLDECRDFVVKSAECAEKGKEHLKAVTCGYCNFFIQYPGIFDLLFHQKASSISTADSKFEKIAGFFKDMTIEDWQMIAGRSSGSTDSDILKKQKYHSLAVHGLLLLYLNNREASDYGRIMQTVKELSDLCD
jgi:AcrR family transcriptional regulator